MMRPALFIADRRDADLVLASVGLADPAVPDLVGADRQQRARLRTVLPAAAQALLMLRGARTWTPDVIDAIEAARDSVNAAAPDAWPLIAAEFSGTGHDLLDMTLPAQWAHRWLTAELTRHGAASPGVWLALGRLQTACGTRLSILRGHDAGEPVPADMPDLADACAAVLAALARWRSAVLFVPAEGGHAITTPRRRAVAQADA